VIGILASRIKERYHRPVIAFAQAGNGQDGKTQLKGSGRSISGLHLRDALDLLAKRQPGLIVRFGGHAMAAGLTIRESDLEFFTREFEVVVGSLLTPADLESVIEVDGALAASDTNWSVACAIEQQVWGQGFPLPAFCDEFEVLEQRVVGERHLKLTLAKEGQRFDAMFFQHSEFLPEKIVAVYQLQTNQFNGAQRVQLNLRHWKALQGFL
jgi:single-stranded-DNA-specific exonuclease